MCKNSNIKGYPAYEITLLFLYAYGSYALAEVMKLSGIMSLFFCGIIMAHYNSYNLSKPSQVTAEHIFKSFALVSEFFVFLYMGMGVCAGQFGRWDFTFVFLAIITCLVARLFNTFPLSWIANQGCVENSPLMWELHGSHESCLNVFPVPQPHYKNPREDASGVMVCRAAWGDCLCLVTVRSITAVPPR
jgi:sodium/hydrogen exchanger 8